MNYFRKHFHECLVAGLHFFHATTIDKSWMFDLLLLDFLLVFVGNLILDVLFLLVDNDFLFLLELLESLDFDFKTFLSCFLEHEFRQRYLILKHKINSEIIFVQQSFQSRNLHWFREHFPHSIFSSKFKILFTIKCTAHNNHEILFSGIQKIRYFPWSLETINARHLNIHKYHLISTLTMIEFLLDRINGLDSIIHTIWFEIIKFKNCLQGQMIEWNIITYQYLSTWTFQFHRITIWLLNTILRWHHILSVLIIPKIFNDKGSPGKLMLTTGDLQFARIK